MDKNVSRYCERTIPSKPNGVTTIASGRNALAGRLAAKKITPPLLRENDTEQAQWCNDYRQRS